MNELPLQDLAISYAAFLVAYLIGSLSFAVIVSKLMRLPDPRGYGSGNPGATNVLRSGNKVAAVLTLLLDAFKGWLPVYLVQRYAFELRIEDSTVAFVGLAAFVGHLFPVFFKFQGGKGVATALGVLLAFEPGLAAATLVLWLAVAVIFRYSSLASILAAMFAPFFAILFFDRPMMSIAVVVMSVLLISRHWRNIVKLLTGKESRIGEKPEPSKRKRRRVRRLDADVGASRFPDDVLDSAVPAPDAPAASRRSGSSRGSRTSSRRAGAPAPSSNSSPSKGNP